MNQKLKETFTRLQTYTKTDLSYLIKGGFWVMTSYVIQVGTGVITMIALANLIPKETLGTYQFILSVAGVLSVITLSGLGTAITRAVATGREGTLRSGVLTKLKWSIGIVLSSGAVSLYYFINDNSVLAMSFLFVGAFAPFIESFKLYENYLHGKKAFRDNVFLGAWRKPLPLIALVTTAWLTSDVLMLVLAYFASNAISFVAVYFSVTRKYDPPREQDPETLTLSKHLSILRFVSHVAQHADKILLWHFLGATAVASFTIAQFATRYSGGLLNSLSALVLPKVSQRDLPTLKETLPRKVWLFTFLMVLGAGMYIAIAPFVFPVLFPEYTESIALSQLLAIGLALLPRNVYANALVAHNKVKQQYFLSAITIVSKLTLLYVLISIYGIWGAVYAVLIADLIAAISVRFFFARA